MTWNPSTGCTKISEGCRHCYAEIMARRLKAMGIEKYSAGFKLRCHKDELAVPYNWKKPRMIFVNSMSDLFHEDMPLDFIQDVFSVMNNCPRHIFQVLTKRADVLNRYNDFLNWTENIWMGVTIETNDYLNRMNLLKKSDAYIKFLSFEPLLGPIENLDLTGIDWVIAGGESGTGARPIKKEWLLIIHSICKSYEVPFFFKQWGGVNKKKAGNLLDGKQYMEMPLVF